METKTNKESHFIVSIDENGEICDSSDTNASMFERPIWNELAEEWESISEDDNQAIFDKAETELSGLMTAKDSLKELRHLLGELSKGGIPHDELLNQLAELSEGRGA